MRTESIAYFEGEFRPASECRLPITDLVVQRGVGVFDTMRLYEGRVFALSDHLRRLEGSARGAGIECAEAIRELERAIRSGASRPDCPGGGDCSVRAYITGGDEMTLNRFTSPRVFAIFEEAHVPPEVDYERGVALEPTREGRPCPTVKSVNYLVGFMQTAGMGGVLECLYCPGGEITETLRSSFFLSAGGKLITAPVGRVLGGVTRAAVIELARENAMEVEERCPRVEELATASEAFITSTLKEVMPVTRIGREAIAGGRPGPVAKRLRELFRQNIGRWLE